MSHSNVQYANADERQLRTDLGVDWTNFNSMPTPYKEITRDEFLLELLCGAYQIDQIDFRQVHDLQEGTYWTLYVYVLHKSVVACATTYQARTNPSVPLSAIWLEPFTGSSYNHALRFFRIGCLHLNMRQESPRMFEHVDVCPDCGFTASHDSSG